MQGELAIVILFSIATGVALAARYLKIPYTVALVLAGLALGPTHLRPPELTQQLLYSVFLPGLLFEAAYHLKFEEFRRSGLRLMALAVPGVIVGMLVTAALLVLGARFLREPLEFGYALVFGAIVAATDPIAVVALFKEVGAPRGLTVLVEGESLLNDGTAVVLFSVVMTLVGSGGSSWVGAALFFVRVVGIGVGIGAAFGLGVALLMKCVDDPMIEIALTAIAAYGSFAFAERVHGSGVLATVTAGMLCGSYAAKVAMTETTRNAVESFWGFVAFALNSIVFLLMGFIVDLRGLALAWPPIVVAFLASLIARAAVVYLVSVALHRTKEHLPWAWSAVLSWGGLRGALSMVLALALPGEFPHRATIVAMTFGVVILSLLVQGLTVSRALRWFGVRAIEPFNEAGTASKGTRRSPVQ